MGAPGSQAFGLGLNHTPSLSGVSSSQMADGGHLGNCVSRFLAVNLLNCINFYKSQLSISFLFFLNLFIFGCLGSSLLLAGFLLLWRAGATLRCGAQASHCGGLSCCGAQALGARASVVVARGL